MTSHSRENHLRMLISSSDAPNRSNSKEMSSLTSRGFEKSPADGDSDYGSDFSPEEEQMVARLLSVHELEDDNPIVNEIDMHDPQRTLRLTGVLSREKRSPILKVAMAAPAVADQIESGKQSPHLGNRVNLSQAPEHNVPQESAAEAPQIPDTRSPLERFRSQRKALSVTDLVSPAWCELQYWYTLTLHGRKRRTPAMKQGSAVHQKLEDEVHSTVTVDIETKEDAWGLRIWNVIQGLRTLRDTGLTRELEIWGTVDGLVVNGVIDELSYVCPDADLEELIHTSSGEKTIPSDQLNILDFFGSAGGGASISDATRINRREKTKKVYIGDVKTRSGRSLPSVAAFRPTRMQLMLYHKLLAALASNALEFDVMVLRYGLDGEKLFSDSLIAQHGGLNNEILSDSQPDSTGSQDWLPWSQDSVKTSLTHNNLTTLWSLMISEFQKTIPDDTSLGKVLKAEYRSRDAGEIIGNKTFAMDENELSNYINHKMEWWRGTREPQGVVIEEAFKCRSCEFAEGCEWRLKKVEDAKTKSRLTRKRKVVV